MDCDDPASSNMLQSVPVLQQLIISAIVVTCFVATKTLLDSYRRRQARMTVVVVGAGPIGLAALLVAVKSSRVSRVVLIEELCKKALFNKPHQIAFNPKSVCFLRRLGVDFDNIEGCWDSGCFFTRLGVLEEYMLSIVYRLPMSVEPEIRLGTKVIHFTNSLTLLKMFCRVQCSCWCVTVLVWSCFVLLHEKYLYIIFI